MYTEQTLKSLRGLSIGDATGENQQKLLPPIYYKAGNVAAHRGVSAMSWPWTDDTAMAIGVVRVLMAHGEIDRLALAKEFANNFKLDGNRGYGRGTFNILQAFLQNPDGWENYSQNWWGPDNGSKGNGSAMRVAPVGAFYGTDVSRVAQEAAKTAHVTHYHPEAIAGAVAVAVAAAIGTYGAVADYWDAILGFVEPGPVRDRIEIVSKPEMLDATNWQVVGAVGNGSHVLCLDTVPFALWVAHQALLRGTFESAVNSVIEVGGDTDTVAAMVGGIIANRREPSQEWIDRTETLPSDLQL